MGFEKNFHNLTFKHMHALRDPVEQSLRMIQTPFTLYRFQMKMVRIHVVLTFRLH